MRDVVEGAGTRPRVVWWGGVAAWATVPVWIAIVATDAHAGGRSGFGLGLLVASAFLWICAFFGLLRLLGDRPITRWMVGVAALGIVATLVPNGSAWVYAGSVLWGAGIAIAGLLFARSGQSKGLVILSLVIAATWVAIGLLGFAGKDSLAATVSNASGVAFFGFTVWVGWVMMFPDRSTPDRTPPPPL